MTIKKVKSKVLADHRKIGKNLVPPYVYLLGQGKDIEWRQRIIPEYLWLGLLNLRLGWIEGADISLSLARIASQSVGVPIEEFKKQFGKATKQFFGLTTSYESLKENQRKEIIKILTEQNKLETLQYGLKSLISLYPKCPLNFLFTEIPVHTEEDFAVIQELVSVFFNQDHNLAVFALTNAVYIAFCTNKLRVIVSDERNSPDDSSLANFPEIERYPNTEESKKVAAAVRMNASMLLHMEKEFSTEWSDYFWNRGLEISKCIPPPIDKLNENNERK